MLRMQRRRSSVAAVTLVLLLALGTGAPAAAAPLPCASSLVATIEEILSALLTLGLPQPVAQVLETVARSAIANADQGNLPAALGAIGALENVVRTLVRTGRLDAVTGDVLLDLLGQARAVLGSCTATPPLVTFNCRSADGENALLWLSPPTGHAATTILYRTDRYPQSPDDPAAVTLGTFAGGLGAVGRATHPGLANGTKYYYAAYGDDGTGVLSPGRLTFGRPESRLGAFRWAYTAGGAARPSVGGFFDALATSSSGGFVYGLDDGPDGGAWAEGWTPVRVPAPVGRPIAMPLVIPPFDRPFALVSSREGRVWALDATGATLWTSPDLGGALRASPCAMFTRFRGTTDIVLVGTADPGGGNRFYGLDLGDGTVAWAFDDGGQGLGPIANGCSIDYDRGRVLFTTEAGGDALAAVWALALGPGVVSQAWSTPIPGLRTAVVRAGTNPADVIYVGTAGGEVHALAAEDGQPRWTTPYATGDGAVKDFVFPSAGRIAFSTTRQVHLVRDDGTTASSVWTAPVTLTDPNVPILTADAVLVADAGGRVYSLDPAAPSPLVAPFASVGDPARLARPGLPYLDNRFGLYTFGTNDGVLYSVERPR